MLHRLYIAGSPQTHTQRPQTHALRSTCTSSRAASSNARGSHAARLTLCRPTCLRLLGALREERVELRDAVLGVGEQVRLDLWRQGQGELVRG